MSISEQDISKIIEHYGTPRSLFRVSWVPISRVDVYNSKVVKITYGDGTFTKAVCSENDVFDLDTGITICLIKRILGGGDCGNKNYNNLIRSVHDLMERDQREREEFKKYKLARKEKQKEIEHKRAEGKARAREEQIEIQKEAYLRAMRELNGEASK